MPTVAIIGASRGIGLEFAKQYAKNGWRVIASVRDPMHIERIHQIDSAIEVHLLDLLDHQSIKIFAQQISGISIDLLIGNGATYGPSSSKIGSIDYLAWVRVMRINVMGHMAVVEELLENVAQSKRKLIVFMSSRYASISEHEGADYIYRSSKAALNSVARGLAMALKPRRVAVLSVSPGWVRTDMGGPNAPLAPQVSVSALIELFAKLDIKDSGRFLNFDGAEIPW